MQRCQISGGKPISFPSVHTRYGLLAIPTTSGSLLSGEGESEMERNRARATESERARYETDDALMFCFAPSFGHRDTPSFACAMVASSYGDHGNRFAIS